MVMGIVPARGIRGDVADIAVKLAYFASPAILRVQWAAEALEISLEADVAEATRSTVERDVTALLARLREGHRPLPPKRCFERRASREPFGEGAEPLTAKLVDAGWARPSSPGAYAFGERFVALVEALDARVRRLTRAALSAKEQAYPSLIAGEVLHRAGYLASFPQSVGFVSHLPHRLGAIERFRDESSRATSFAPPAETAPPTECLPPAVCHHRFHALSGERLSAGSVVTARGACFRYEARHNMRDLSRLWCFQMREIVYVGDPVFVRDAAGRASEALLALVHDLDLSGICESASDPFFADVFAEKRYAQLAHDRKVELRLPLGGGETIAAASINVHEDLFGRAFSIEQPSGEPAVSGCAAFGLERLALAFLAQHGLDEARWPRVVVELAAERARGH